MQRRDFLKLSAIATASCLGTGFIMTGCSNGSSDSGSSSSDGSGRTVRIATMGNGEPYSLVDDSGNWTGMEADMWAEVEKRMGWTIDMEAAGDASSVFGDLASSRVDVAANCYAITAKRLETYIACDPIYADAQVVIVQPDSPYQTLEDLRGATIGVTSGQAAQSTIESLAPQYDWEIVTYEDSTAGFQDCALGRVDCYANTVTNIEKAERAQGLEFRMLDEKLFGNNVSWFLMPAETELRDELNKVIAAMHEDGTLSALCEKWFYEDLTKLISTDWLTADK
ncbi:MAG: transporter substrate-binding domain-containing protein [Eggerthellaceae bacterium]|nr:transporter substrate-binding domain-containing protein [Eggerthellaceae bacterium]